MRRPRVIVLHCFSRIGLAVINGLAPGNDLIGGMLDRSGMRWLRYEQWLRSGKLEDVFRYPAPDRDYEGFRDAIFDACRRFDVDAVFPTGTGLAIALSHMRDELPADISTRFVVE